MRVIGYDDAYFDTNSRLACVTWTHVSKRWVGEGRKVKGHEDQWGQKHLLRKYEYPSLIPRPTQKLTCSMNIWTPTVSEADRRLLAAHRPAIQPCLCNRKTETLPQIRWTVTTDTWGCPVISICTLIQAYPRSHVWMVTHTAFIKIKQWKICLFAWSHVCYSFLQNIIINRKGKQRGFSLNVFLQQ